MNAAQYRARYCGVVVLAIVGLALAPVGAAEKNGAEPIPRVLLVGDSWPMFLSSGLLFWQYENGSAFRDVLPEMGYGRWGDIGTTALGMSMLTEWATNAIGLTPYGELMGRLDFIAYELTHKPTLDIVHICVGGNDYMRGDYRPFVDYEEFQMQTIEFLGAPTGGTFRLSFQGQTTAPIAFGAAAGAVQSALEALSTIGVGNIEVLPTSGRPTYFCWFQGVFSETAVPLMTANGSGLTGDGDEGVAVHGVTFEHGWKDTWGTESPAELMFAEAIALLMQTMYEFVLDVRPDVRVLICDYDYMDEAEGGATVQEANRALANSGRIKLAVVDEIRANPQYTNRCFYLNTFGLMQWWFGIPCDFELISPIPNEERRQTTLREDQLYGPRGEPGLVGTLSLPGQFPGYTPWMGGNVDYPPPRISIIYNFGKEDWAPVWAKELKGANIHLHKEANHVYARFCVEQYYGAWLDLPKVIAIEKATYNPLNPSELVPEPTAFDQVTFEVTFSEPVTGVDEADFDLVMHGVATASIESVEETKDGATYAVLVNTGIGDGTLGLAVLDNDSITAVDDGAPLAGDANGYWAYGEAYEMDRTAGAALPVAVWPAGLIVLAAGMSLLRRRS